MEQIDPQGAAPRGADQPAGRLRQRNPPHAVPAGDKHRRAVYEDEGVKKGLGMIFIQQAGYGRLPAGQGAGGRHPRQVGQPQQGQSFSIPESIRPAVQKISQARVNKDGGAEPVDPEIFIEPVVFLPQEVLKGRKQGEKDKGQKKQVAELPVRQAFYKFPQQRQGHEQGNVGVQIPEGQVPVPVKKPGRKLSDLETSPPQPHLIQIVNEGPEQQHRPDPADAVPPQPAGGFLPIQQKRPCYGKKQGHGTFAENGDHEIHPERDASPVLKGKQEEAVFPRMIENHKEAGDDADEFDVQVPLSIHIENLLRITDPILFLFLQKIKYLFCIVFSEFDTVPAAGRQKIFSALKSSFSVSLKT